jgi:hypothetical protein
VALLIAIVVVIALSLAFWSRSRDLPPDPAPDAASTTGPASDPTTTTAPASTRPLVRTWEDVLRAHHGEAANVQPLPVSADLADAAPLVIRDGIHLDSRGHLWITRHDAPPIADVIATAANEQVHVVRESVRYVHWVFQNGQWTCVPLVAREDDTVLASNPRKQVLRAQTQADFARALSLQGVAFVPTRAGVAALRFEPSGVEALLTVFPSIANTSAPTQMLLDGRGLLTWVPWKAATPGSKRPQRFLDGAWTDTDQIDWPERIVHLLPLADGTVRVLHLADGDAATISTVALEKREVDAARATALVRDLSDPDPAVRETATRELTALGSGAWAVLERLLPDQSPEAQTRLQAILAERLTPTLGGFSPVNGEVRIAQHLRNGGVVLQAPQGWRTIGADGGETIVPHGFLLIVPGAPPSLPPDPLLEQITQGHRLENFGPEWIAESPADGVLRLVGNSFEPILPTRFAAFSRFVGIDARGRWILRKPADDGETLVLDPTVANPIPRMPNWLIALGPDQSIGQTPDGWPVTKSGDAWALKADGWELLKNAELRPIEPPASTQSALVSSDGRSLLLPDASGVARPYPLPAELPSAAAAPFVVLADQRTVLMASEPGKIHRLRVEGDTLRLLATHTRHIPLDALPTAMWLDPAGRLVLAYPPDRLVIAFPDGRVPRSMQNLMPARSPREED